MTTGYLEHATEPRFESFEEVLHLLNDANRLMIHQWIAGHGFENTIIDHAIGMLTDDIHWLSPWNCIPPLLGHIDNIYHVGLGKFLIDWIVHGPRKDWRVFEVLLKLFSQPHKDPTTANVLMVLNGAVTNALLIDKSRQHPEDPLLGSAWILDLCRYHISCDRQECSDKRARGKPNTSLKSRGWQEPEEKWTRPYVVKVGTYVVFNGGMAIRV
ncbi:hypothetical protein AC579_8646 [Pseudocercospora musae]|uniref:Uncharacterized protein n=1 Tax=Pseudocercospora musae TaxID=113226 RepID=A0A139IFI1_9PEZI|nr:hypothetical protein AC579_8646 [Pseudocercospora musae]